jgi:hypothetical protein
MAQVRIERGNRIVGQFGQLAIPRDDPASRSQPESSVFDALGTYSWESTVYPMHVSVATLADDVHGGGYAAA